MAPDHGRDGLRLSTWRRILLGPIVLVSLSLWVHRSGLDAAILKSFVAPGSDHSRLTQHWYFGWLLPNGGLGIVLLAGAALALASFAGPTGIRAPSRRLLIGVVSTPAIAAGLSWGLGPPAPDAVMAAGFAWIGLVHLSPNGRPVQRALSVLPGLGLGFLLSFARVARDLQPPSGVLLSIALAWLVSELQSFAAGRSERPRGPADGAQGARHEELNEFERVLPWVAAVGAGMLGVGFFSADLLIDEFGSWGVHLGESFETVELCVMALGLGAAAYFLAEHLRDSRLRARSRLEAEREERFRMLGRVAASVAHEVRNPLHAMRLIVDEQKQTIPALASDPLGAEFESCLQRIDHAVDLVYRLARPESEEGETADLVRVVQESVRRIERSSPTACEFRWSTDPAAGAVVRGSPISLGIVVDNLLRNAATATPRGSAVGLALVSTPGHWNLRIVNPGSVDQRVSESGTSERLGLGLSISRQIASNLGATIELWSTDGLVTCELTWPAPEGEAT